jgi:hypothetical protein
MFWKESKGLKSLSTSAKIALTGFLIIVGISYLFGFMNIYFTYSPIDKEAGLSLRDIQIAFYGSREETKLEKSIDGTMREYFTTDGEYNTVKEWISAGAAEKDFASVQMIFDNSCNTCHSEDVKVAGVSLQTFDDVKQYLVQDTGKSVSRLVSLSHTHLFSIVAIVFLLVFIFSFTLFPEKFKQFLFTLSFLAVVIDVGAWWLAKASSALAPVVLIGGALVAVSFALLILLSLFDMWARKSS